ncbi:unnamed protein product [Cladocopium goreaui]|uniref:Cyclic nucleotide-binding domain-containing protein n=1 Tax=Cladocopium goreaui TaxID=2562237 RepID=A0A9P1GE95_9DINO|nr:unnamed protein product [Cladocopium goreaui]
MSKTPEVPKEGPTSPRSDASNISAFSQRPTRLLDLLPVAPWCGKCLPQPPDGQLPIKPEELVLGQAADIKALTENINEYGRLNTGSKRTASRSRAAVQEGPVKFHNRQSRIEQLSERLKLTASHPTTFFARTVERPEEIELMPSMTRSRFSQDDFAGYVVQLNPEDSDSDSERGVAKPLTQFTTEQVSRMELVALNHVKMQTLKQRIAEEGVHSIRATAADAARWDVSRRNASGDHWEPEISWKGEMISPEENYYLMAQLRFLPFFNEVPQELYETIVEHTTTQTYVPGCHLFSEGETANSLFLILTGQVHLRSETHVAMDYDTMKSSPALLLPHDLFSQSRG